LSLSYADINKGAFSFYLTPASVHFYSLRRSAGSFKTNSANCSKFRHSDGGGLGISLAVTSHFLNKPNDRLGFANRYLKLGESDKAIADVREWAVAKILKQ
jgi:hypothetical protein